MAHPQKITGTYTEAPQLSAFLAVKFLTLSMASFLLCGCSYINSHWGESCNSRAHVQIVLADYLNRRYPSHSPVRLAIIPFSVAANISAYSAEQPGAGNQLAWMMHRRLLSSGELPIVEVFNRQDWPGKKDEFFTGNFGAISLARQAGYDLVLVGYLEDMKSIDSMTAHAKLIEAESGITVWYGTSAVHTRRDDFHTIASKFPMIDERPDYLYTTPLMEELASCVVSELLSEEPVPG